MESVRPLAFLTAYHQGGPVLSALLGESEIPNWAALGLTAGVPGLTIWAPRRLYPDVYEGGREPRV